MNSHTIFFTANEIRRSAYFQQESTTTHTTTNSVTIPYSTLLRQTNYLLFVAH